MPRSFASFFTLPPFAIAGIAVAVTIAGPVDAQQPRPAPPRLAAKFDVAAATVQTLVPIPGGNGQFAVPVQLGADARTMVLVPYEIRSAGFQLLVEDATGIHQVPTPPCTTYRGSLLEEPATAVAASIVGGAVSAIVYRPGVAGALGENWVVQPAREVEPTAGASVHVVYRATDTVPLPYQCGVGPGGPPAPQASFLLGGAVECDIALEADVQFYQQNGSNVVATQNDITAVMNQLEFIYDRDCDIQYDVTTILVTTTPVYTTSNSGPLLNQFTSRWNTVHAGIPRDVAHLFTGRNLTGSIIGVAWLSSICNLSSAYGLSQSRFTSNFNSRVGLTSHEIGHGWSAQHCDGNNPCYIMCAGLGGCSGSVTLFGPGEIGQITSFAASRTCLSSVATAPQITGVNPGSVTVFNPGNVILTGSGFTGATSYRVGTQVYSSGFFVSSDSTMSVAMPAGTAVGPTTIGVTNPQGTSNSFPSSYTLTAPPKLKATASVPSTGGVASFDFAGTPGRSWFLVLGISNTTTPFQGFPLLDPQLLLTAGAFGPPLGVANVSIPVPPGLGLLIFYLQVLEADATPAATGTSNIVTTVLL